VVYCHKKARAGAQAEADVQIETERLILRPWKGEDAEELYKYAKDPRVGPRAGWPPHTDVEDSARIIAGVLSEPETYAVVLKQTGKPVGSVGIMMGSGRSGCSKDDEAELGAWIGVPYWGMGLIPEALNALLRRCFTELDCSGVWCGYHEGNFRSRRIQEKCGFTYHHCEERETPGEDGSRATHYTYQSRAQWEGNDGFHPGIYRHFKGKEYELLYTATDSETREEVVVYRALYGECGVWVRPKRMWNETVERDGQSYRRFTYIKASARR